MDYTFTEIDDQRVEVNVAAAFRRMAADFQRDTGCSLHVRDGSRTRAEQQTEWDAYVTRGKNPPRVAYPGESNHEIDGPNGPRSIDIYDSGDDAGVTSFGTARDGWMQRNAGNYGFENEGNNFGEPWHKTFRGDIGGSGGGSLSPTQRVAGADGVRARRSPSTSAAIDDSAFLAEGEVGNFSGWVVGENVAGESRWLKGAVSGNFYWLGGLTPQTVDGLPSLGGSEAPLAAYQRRADGDGVKGRADATTKSPQVTFLEPNDIGDFNAWKHGESIDGEDRWIRGAYSGAWFWLGGVTAKNTNGLTEIPIGIPPVVSPPSGTGRVADDPKVPGTFLGRWSPNCEKRTGHQDYFVIHHAADTRDVSVQVDRFMTANDREVSPTWFVGASGSSTKIVHPDDRQWTTGKIIDQQAVTVETQNTTGAPNWGISEASIETIAQLVAWWSKTYNGKLDRDHVLGHDEARVKLDPSIGATACPGPSMDLDRIVKRAQEINAPVIPQPGDTIPVDRSWLQQVFDKLKALLGK